MAAMARPMPSFIAISANAVCNRKSFVALKSLLTLIPQGVFVFLEDTPPLPNALRAGSLRPFFIVPAVVCGPTFGLGTRHSIR